MVTSYIIHTLIYIYILSISPQSAALETFNGAISTSNLFFLLQLASFQNASCVKWSFNSHPSNRVSCSLYELRIESVFERARSLTHASRSFVSFVCGRACFRLQFRFVSFSRVLVVHYTQKKELAAGFDPSPSELAVAC